MNKTLTIIDVAKLAHKTNRIYCSLIGDDSQPNWGAAPDWQKESAINGVKFHLANPDASPAISHENWLAEKKGTGWTYGPIKDPEKKQHPCFMPYDQLPPEQKAKDSLFKGIIEACRPLIEPDPAPAAAEPDPAIGGNSQTTTA